jgi:hypothetical protein
MAGFHLSYHGGAVTLQVMLGFDQKMAGLLMGFNQYLQRRKSTMSYKNMSSTLAH